MSYPLMIGCPACGKTYDYADSEDTFQQKELPLDPPIGYADRLLQDQARTRPARLDDLQNQATALRPTS
jgi:hypothetical protein